MLIWTPSPLNQLPRHERWGKLSACPTESGTPLVIVYDRGHGWSSYYATDDRQGKGLQFNACRLARVGRSNVVIMNDAHWAQAQLTMGGFNVA